MEEALGGPAALQASPLQRVAGGASYVVNLPARYAAETVNRTVEGVQQGTEQTRATLSSVAGKAAQFTGAVRESLTVGRNASLQRAEKLARREGDASTARAVGEEMSQSRPATLAPTWPSTRTCAPGARGGSTGTTVPECAARRRPRTRVSWYGGDDLRAQPRGARSAAPTTMPST